MRRRAWVLIVVAALVAAISPARAQEPATHADRALTAALDALRVAANLKGVTDRPAFGGSPAVPAATHAATADAATNTSARTERIEPADALRALARATASDEGATVAILDRLSPSYRVAVGDIAAAMARAEILRDQAFARVSRVDIARARVLAARLSAGARAMDPAEAEALASVVARIDPVPMLEGSTLLARVIARVAASLDPNDAPEDVECTANHVICVGTSGDDVHEMDAQLLLDPAGDDLYLNDAAGGLHSIAAPVSGGCVLGGGTTGNARPDLGCTAAPPAACTYDVANNATGREDLPVVNVPGHDDPGGGNAGRGADGSCGSAARGDAVRRAAEGAGDDPDARAVTVLVDLDGNDTYTAPWSHDDPLFDLIEACFPGDAAKVNTNLDFAQGGALAGIAILWDAGTGDDRYRGRLNVQGSGHLGGVGILVSSGTGSDLFWADRLSQGSGIAGGIGILASAKDGDHTFLLEPPVVYRNEFAPNGRNCAQEGRAGQGQGGFGGVGVLWNDHLGSARYRAVTHVVSTAAPYEPVRDEQGRAIVVGGSDAQGSGESFPIPDTPGGIVLGAGLLFDRTRGDAGVCAARPDGTPSAGMSEPSTTGTGTALSSVGAVAPCGTFNLPSELDPASDLSGAVSHLLAGAAGVRVVVPR